MTIHEKIEALMKERGWTRYRLARESGLSSSTVLNLFYRNNVPSLATIEAIAEAFGITLAQFFYDGDEIIELSEEQREMLHYWGLLTKQQRQLLIDVAKSYNAND